MLFFLIHFGNKKYAEKRKNACYDLSRNRFSSHQRVGIIESLKSLHPTVVCTRTVCLYLHVGLIFQYCSFYQCKDSRMECQAMLCALSEYMTHQRTHRIEVPLHCQNKLPKSLVAFPPTTMK
jgi:hypothetical protein